MEKYDQTYEKCIGNYWKTIQIEYCIREMNYLFH